MPGQKALVLLGLLELGAECCIFRGQALVILQKAHQGAAELVGLVLVKVGTLALCCELHRLGNLMLLSRRKNTSLGRLNFVDKKTCYFEHNVETLPNSARLLIMPDFNVQRVEKRHKELLSRLREFY